MQTIIQRLSASLLLSPAILLLLVWIGTFAGGEAVIKMGLIYFVLSAAVASIAIAYCVTLYATYLLSQWNRK